MSKTQHAVLAIASIGLLALLANSRESSHLALRQPNHSPALRAPHVDADSPVAQVVSDPSREPPEQASPRREPLPRQQLAELSNQQVDLASQKWLIDEALYHARPDQRLRALGRLAARIDDLPAFKSRLLDRLAVVEPAEALVIAIVLRQSRDLATHQRFTAALQTLPAKTQELLRRALP